MLVTFIKLVQRMKDFFDNGNVGILFYVSIFL